MAFLVRKPFIFIIIGIVSLVLIVQFSGVLRPKPPVEIAPSLSASTISMNKNVTLTVVIENKGARSYSSVEFRIVGRFNSSQLRFYDGISGASLPEPVLTGSNYTITYPKTWPLDVGGKLTIPVIINGLDPRISSITYPIYLEVWADKALSDRKSVQLTVTHS